MGDDILITLRLRPSQGEMDQVERQMRTMLDVFIGTYQLIEFEVGDGTPNVGQDGRKVETGQ